MLSRSFYIIASVTVGKATLSGLPLSTLSPFFFKFSFLGACRGRAEWTYRPRYDDYMLTCARTLIASRWIIDMQHNTSSKPPKTLQADTQKIFSHNQAFETTPYPSKLLDGHPRVSRTGPQASLRSTSIRKSTHSHNTVFNHEL